MKLIELLSQNPIFANLSNTDKESLAQSAITRSYQKGEWISHLGDVWPYLFVVEEGCVTPLKESAERSLIVVELGEGEVFWGLSFFLEEAPMPVALVAKEDCRISMWPIDHISTLT